MLFFELRETDDDEPFLLIYLHRNKGEEFDPARTSVFATLQECCSNGAIIKQTEE